MSVMSHTRLSHFTHINELCCACDWIMSRMYWETLRAVSWHIWLYYVTRSIIWLCHTLIYFIWNKCVTHYFVPYAQFRGIYNNIMSHACWHVSGHAARAAHDCVTYTWLSHFTHMKESCLFSWVRWHVERHVNKSLSVISLRYVHDSLLTVPFNSDILWIGFFVWSLLVGEVTHRKVCKYITFSNLLEWFLWSMYTIFFSQNKFFDGLFLWWYSVNRSLCVVSFRGWGHMSEGM